MPNAYEHLNGYEREQIAYMLIKKASFAAIGRDLGRATSTISREVGRNGGRAGYFARAADRRARQLREKARRGFKITGEVARRIIRCLKRYWSPEQIEGRGLLEGIDVVNRMTIYRFLARPEGMDYRMFLRGPEQRRRHNRKVHERIHDRVMIDERPAEVAAKKEPGHWEGDTIRGPMKTEGCVMTLVERTSQFLVAGLLADRTAGALNQKAARALKHHGAKTLTVDNGMEFASHRKLREQSGTPIYFAHEKSPWERGLNEQVNGLLRQFFPKGTDLGEVTSAQLRRAVDLLNNRPRKKLGYKTPNEEWKCLNVALAM